MVEPPLWKLWVRQLGWLFPIYRKTKKCSKPPTSYFFSPTFMAGHLLCIKSSQQFLDIRRKVWRVMPSCPLKWLGLAANRPSSPVGKPSPLFSSVTKTVYVLHILERLSGWSSQIYPLWTQGQLATALEEVDGHGWYFWVIRAFYFDDFPRTKHLLQGLVNVLIERHPTIGDIQKYNLQ